jgi:OMF family outer membrane factor
MLSIRTCLVWLAAGGLLGGAARGEKLEEAWSLALAQNDRLAAAQMQQVAANQDASAVAAERMPSLSLHGSYTVRTDEPSFVVTDPLPGVGTFQFPYAERNAGAMGAEMRIPVYTSGRIENSLRSAEARGAAADFDAGQARLNLLFSVGEAFITVLRTQREVEAAQRESESLDAHTADVQQLFAQQRVPQGDLLAAQVALASARQHQLQQTRTLEVARGRYNRLLGRPLLVDAPLEDVNFPPISSSLDELVQAAYEHRPDLQALLAESNSHYFASECARANARPQFSAVAGCQFDENRFESPQTLGTAAVVLDWNLFNGGKTARTAAAELARTESARRLAADLKSQIALDLLEAWNGQAQAADQLEVASQTLNHATENLRVIQARFSSGMVLNAAVLDAQSQWAQATRDYQNAVYLRALAQLRLRYLAAML